MKMRLNLAFILLVVPYVSSNNFYCGLASCPNRSHTLCKYQTDITADKCGETYHFTLSDEDKNSIYETFLGLREMAIARWEEFTAVNAIHPTELKWNKELARAAQKWANQCEDRLDQCRHVERHRVDQRIAVCVVNNNIIQPSPSNTLKYWYNLDPFTSFHSRRARESSGVRSLWQTAMEIGCGTTQTDKYLFLVCNFAPVEYNVHFDPNYKD